MASTGPADTVTVTERAALLAVLERLSDARTARLARRESTAVLRVDVAMRQHAEAAIRKYGHIGATWMDDRGELIP